MTHCTSGSLGLMSNCKVKLYPSLKSFAASNLFSSNVTAFKCTYLQIKSDQTVKAKPASTQHDATTAIYHIGESVVTVTWTHGWCLSGIYTNFHVYLGAGKNTCEPGINPMQIGVCEGKVVTYLYTILYSILFCALQVSQCFPIANFQYKYLVSADF